MAKCFTCDQEITIDCDWRQGRCPHRPPMVDIEPLLKMAIQPKDTSKGHFYVSVCKSAVRIAAGAALIMGAFAVCGWLFILAEVLGIVEEVV